MRTFKHITWDDRLRIETMLKDQKTPKEIAARIGVHISTVYREMERGQYEHKNSDWTTEKRYSPDIAEERYRANLAAKGAPLKIGADYKLAEHIEKKIIKDKYSPAAVLGEIKNHGTEFSVTICTNTLYSYIEKGVFLNLTNKHLPEKWKRKRNYKKVRRAHAPKGESIEKRPEEVNERNTFGHWEMDTVKGRRNTKKVLLVLTERLSRDEVTIRMKDCTAESVVRSLDALERKYGDMFPRVFRTITVDNGSEFSDCAGMERSRTGKGNRTQIFYCHPYSSYERGSNEVQNKLIRRHIPKGTPLEKVSAEKVQYIEDWINNYPRAIFGFRTAAEVFAECLSAVP